MNTDWLSKITGDHDCGIRWAWRQQTNAVVIDGQTWLCATDGRILAAIAHDGPTTEDKRAVECLSEIFAKAAKGETIGETTAETIAAWCGPREDAKERACSNCGGDGQCDDCRCETVHDCGYCDGSGKEMGEPETRFGLIGKSLFDRNLLALAFPHVAGPCEVAKDKAGLWRFSGDGWRVLVMEIATRDKDAAKAATVLELTK